MKVRHFHQLLHDMRFIIIIIIAEEIFQSFLMHKNTYNRTFVSFQLKLHKSKKKNCNVATDLIFY